MYLKVKVTQTHKHFFPAEVYSDRLFDVDFYLV